MTKIAFVILYLSINGVVNASKTFVIGSEGINLNPTILGKEVTIDGNAPWYSGISWYDLFVFVAGFPVLLTGIRAIIRASHSDLFRREILVHGFSLLAATALGLFSHSMNEQASQRAIAEDRFAAPSLIAYDRVYNAKHDMMFCTVIFLGSLLGGAATLRNARHNLKSKTEQVVPPNGP